MSLFTRARRCRSAVSPDGTHARHRLQGSIWTLPAARRRRQARSPTSSTTRASRPGRLTANGSPSSPTATAATTSGRSRPTASNLHKLTWGPFDDREPTWSHDGTRVAFSSDRGDPLGSDYNIWMLDTRSGELKQLTKNPADDYMPIVVARRQGDRLRVDARRTRPPSGRSTSPTVTERKAERRPAGASTRRRGGLAVSSCTTSRSAPGAQPGT